MKYLHYLALIGALGTTEALQLTAKDTCQAQLATCTAQNDKTLFLRWLVKTKQRWTAQYTQWWNQRRDSQMLAQTGEEDCSQKLSACKANAQMLENYSHSLEDKKLAKKFNRRYGKHMKRMKNKRYAKRMTRKLNKFQQENPLQPNDGAIEDSEESEESSETEEQSQSETDGESDNENNDDEKLPEIEQKKGVDMKTCDGSILRLLDEAKGKVTPAAGTLWNDQSFPADWTSLDWNKKRTDSWVRPTEYEASPSLYGSKGINPGAVKQGSLGDCWYLAAISAVGEFPQRVKNIFRGANSYPSNGQVVLDLYLYGKPHRVMIDDKLPGNGVGSKFRPVFTKRGPNGAWWGPLLEKAAAKYWGHYQAMSGGWMSDAFDMLTGQPVESFGNSKLSIDDIWTRIHEWEQKQVIMSTGCFKTKDSNGKDEEKHGLVTGHAYTTIGSVIYEDKQKKQHRLIKMRNPWGTERYTGPWSDNSSEMNKDGGDAMQTLGHVNKRDGTFFVPVELYKTLFSGAVGLVYNDDWKRGHKMASWDRVSNYKEIKHTFYNPVQQDVSVQLSTPQARMFKTRDCSSKYRSEAFYWRIVDQDGHGWVNMWANLKSLPEGNYDLVITHLSNNKPKYKGVMDFGLSALGSLQAPEWKN